ncbi:MAG: aspartate carbamoyltransferase catalytic subunit, partial [Actinomycetia bacterium]|nr:aspartate carbamoyltransferase catalytic subunit [Actinomycetes bacterium]
MLLKSKHLLGIDDLDKEDIKIILKLSESFKEVLLRPIKKVPTLRGRTIVNLFLEPSTRTRTSFELAAKRLSADVINIGSATSAISKGESLKDTAKTLEALKVDAIVIRHRFPGAPHFLSKLADFSVINAGDGGHEHPTQALLDIFSIIEKKGTVKGLKILIVGDILHSRVARSNILALIKLGAEIVLVAPPTLMPGEIEKLGVKVEFDFDKALKGADIIYLLRLQMERQTECYIPSLREYTSLYGLNLKRVKKAKDDVIIMHPGPINRGIEISADV